MEEIRQSQKLAFGRGAELTLIEVDDAEPFEYAAQTVRDRLPSQVLEWLDRHVPDDIEVRENAEALSFVRRAVVCAEPLNEHSASLVFLAVVGLVRWAHLDEGLPLDRAVLFDSGTTDMYLARLLEAGRAEGTVRNYRGYLNRAATALGVVSAGAPSSIPGRSMAAPYTLEAEGRLSMWARGLRGEINVARGLALLGLAAGAGLREREIRMVQARHVIDQGGMWVRVNGEDDRLTPVRKEWGPHLRLAMQNLAPDDFVFPRGESTTTGLVKNWIKTCPGRGRPVPGRLRNTWIVAHLRAGVEPRNLLAWSGVERGETISHFLTYVPDATEQLRRVYVHLRVPNIRHVWHN